MSNVMQNINPKRNPITSILGGVFILISAGMYIVKYLVPAFIVMKQEIPYEWYVPVVPLLIGILLAFINDEYFSRMFNRADKFAAKKTDTEK